MHENMIKKKDRDVYILFATNGHVSTYEQHYSACSAYVDAKRMEEAGYKVTVIKVNACCHSADMVGIYVYKQQMSDLTASALEEIKLLETNKEEKTK
jgi:hypothetical protein